MTTTVYHLERLNMLHTGDVAQLICIKVMKKHYPVSASKTLGVEVLISTIELFERAVNAAGIGEPLRGVHNHIDEQFTLWRLDQPCEQIHRQSADAKRIDKRECRR